MYIFAYIPTTAIENFINYQIVEYELFFFHCGLKVSNLSRPRSFEIINIIGLFLSLFWIPSARENSEEDIMLSKFRANDETSRCIN